MKQYFAKEIEGELMLCSRDIQVGDKMWHNVFHKYYDVEKPHNGNGVPVKGLFLIGGILYDERNKYLMYDMYAKVIGKISPSAIWVKIGDEFDESEIKKIYACNATIITRAHKSEEPFIVGSNPDPKAIEEYFQDEIEYNEHKYWGQNITIDENNPFIHHVQLNGPCGHFH